MPETPKNSTLPGYRVGMLIRSRHPQAFRSGQWGQIVGVREVTVTVNNRRPCFEVKWDASDSLDKTDLWPVEDAAARYQFATLEAQDA